MLVGYHMEYPATLFWNGFHVMRITVITYFNQIWKVYCTPDPF